MSEIACEIYRETGAPGYDGDFLEQYFEIGAESLPNEQVVIAVQQQTKINIRGSTPDQTQYYRFQNDLNIECLKGLLSLWIRLRVQDWKE
jgi:hypothetical protein